MISGLSLPYRFKKSNQNRLIICLHGYGSSMDDLFSFADDLTNFGHVVSLNAPYSTPWGGYAWFDLTYGQDGSVRIDDINQIESSVVLLKQEILKIQKSLAVPSTNTLLLGFSQGAMMALEYTFTINEPLLAAVILSGRGVVSENPLVDSTAIIQTHGVQDQVIPIADARKLNIQLSKQMKNYVYQEYEDMGHGISPTCWQFVLEQIKAITS